MAGTTARAGGRDPRRPARLIPLYALLIALTLLFVAPILWMFSTSLKPNYLTTRFPPQWIPQQPTFEGYATLMTTASETPVLRWFLNSVIAGSAHALLVVATSAMAAYALARMRFRGKNVIFAVVVATLFIPPITFLIPNYLIVDTFGWLDTLLAVIVPTAAGAFGVFFLRQFFLSLPRELEEAAFIDGANRFRTFVSVVLPLSRPALVTLGILSFLTNWNDFLWPVYVLFSPDNQTLPAGLSTLQNANAVRYDLLMAGAVIASVPVLVLYMAAQRYVVEGVSRAGLKG